MGSILLLDLIKKKKRFNLTQRPDERRYLQLGKNCLEATVRYEKVFYYSLYMTVLNAF